MKKLILISIFISILILLISCTQEQENQFREKYQGEIKGEIKEEPKVEEKTAEKLKSELEKQEYTVYLVVEGSNNKGSYINIIYKDTFEGFVINQARLYELSLRYFPDKDFYVVSFMDLDKEMLGNYKRGEDMVGESNYWVFNKKDAVHISKNEMDVPVPSLLAFSFNTMSGKWKEAHSLLVSKPSDSLEFQLSQEEYSLLEFENIKAKKRIAEFEGTENTKTQTFSVESGNAEISYLYFDDNPDSSMELYVMKLGESKYSAMGSIRGTITVGDIQSGKTKIQLPEKGTFYLDIKASNIEWWVVSIYEVR